MTPLTLLYSGTEKFLGADPAGGGASGWGYSIGILRLLSRAPSTFTVRKVGGDPAGAAEVPFHGQVTIYKDRVYSDGAFSGGRVIFKGSRVDFNGVASPEAPATMMTFADAWHDLQYTPFQHYWKNRPGGTLADFYFSRINLFQDISAGPDSPWGYLTTAQQITEIITYAHANCGLPLQLGTVDPAWNLPLYGCKAISCADALLLCLRSVPDAVTYFDYTTTPPTLHIRQRANLAAVSLPYADGVKHQSSQIKPRPDLQPAAVVIQYQKVNQVNGVSYTSLANDAYPPGATGAAFSAIVAPVDLRGGVKTDVFGSVTALAVDPTSTDFWKRKKPDMSDTSVTGLTILSDSDHPVKVTAEDGTDLTSSWAANWPREITSGSVANWMTYDFGGGPVAITAQEATITAWATYAKTSTVGYATPLHVLAAHQISCRVKLTNSPDGATNYSALAHYDPGETAPSGLAQNIYTGLAALQWEGRHIIVEDSVTDYSDTGYWSLSPRFTLNLTGGNSDWATMAAAIYDVEIDFFHGRTTVSFGPHKHLAPAEFFEILMFFRFRLVFDNPNIRNTGRDSNGSNVQLPTDGQKENTGHGVPEQTIHSLQSGPDEDGHQLVIRHDTTDPTTGPYLAKTIDHTDGSTITSRTGGVDDAAHIFLRFSELVGKNKKVYFQAVHLCVDGNDKICYLPCTDPE